MVTDEYDRRTDFDFWRGLGIRLGQEEHWPWRSLEESYDERPKGTGRSFDDVASTLGQDFPQETPEYRKYERTGFATPTKKVELYSTIFERLGYSPLPYYEPHPDAPERKPDPEGAPPLHRHQWRAELLVHAVGLAASRGHAAAASLSGSANPPGYGPDAWPGGGGLGVGREPPRPDTPENQPCTMGSGRMCCTPTANGGYPELGGVEPSFFGIWISNINLLIDDDPAKCNEVLGSWPLKRIQARVYKADAAEDRRLAAIIERLCLAEGEAMPDLSEEDRDAIRSYSLQAMAWSVTGERVGGAEAGADRVLQ